MSASILKIQCWQYVIRNQAKGRLLKIVNNEIINGFVENNPRQAVHEIASQMNVSHSTIVRHLAKIDKVKKMDKCVPHELSDVQKHKRMEIAA